MNIFFLVSVPPNNLFLSLALVSPVFLFIFRSKIEFYKLVMKTSCVLFLYWYSTLVNVLPVPLFMGSFTACLLPD